MSVDETVSAQTLDDPTARKSRGAFFTPIEIARHLADWAIRSPNDAVLEPSAGEAAFMVAAARRLQVLGNEAPTVHGVEIHAPSAAAAQAAVETVGAGAIIEISDFFLVDAVPTFDAVIGNPPFIRYQEWVGSQRDRARFAALQQGVALTGLASSWAAFVAHSAGFLKPGGRLGLVLPAELLSVNYAAPVRRFLLESFENVELIVFDEQVFPDAEADTVLVKASGWRWAPAGTARLRQTRNAKSLGSEQLDPSWAPIGMTERWTPHALTEMSLDTIRLLTESGSFATLSSIGDVSLGAVTGGNRFFTLSPQRAQDLGIPRRDLLKISPPGSSHLRGLALTDSAVTRLGRQGQATWLLYPSERPADATARYIDFGHATGIDSAYKCRVRNPWWRVPVLNPPDLFLTYMNADTVRLTTNRARARHLNSVHGVYLKAASAALNDLLPIASLNSLTLLSAEIVGRSYGGGILKMEPREADRWLMPAPELVRKVASELFLAKGRVQRLLQAKQLSSAVQVVDQIVFGGIAPEAALDAIRSDRLALAGRREVRGRSNARSK